jgi:hypothetical protein
MKLHTALDRDIFKYFEIKMLFTFLNTEYFFSKNIKFNIPNN